MKTEALSSSQGGSHRPTPSKQKELDERPQGTPVPDIFSHLDYRVYLGAWFKVRKLLQPGYSGATFAKKAGLQSHTILGMVIRGDRNLSADSTRGFIRALSLKSKEALYFEKLVLFNQSKNSDDRAYYFDQLHTLASHSKGGGQKLLTSIQNHAKYFGHWYNVAIREMVHLPDFSSNPEWIATKLKKKITKKQAEEAFQLLLAIGLVIPFEKDGQTQYEVVDPMIDVDPSSIDFAIRNFHKEYLERSMQSLDGEPIDERELSSLTMTVSEKDFGEIRQKIKEFRKSLNTDYPVSKDPRTQVIAINMQLLTITTPNPTQIKTK